MNVPIVLSANADLTGRDLQHVYRLAKVGPDPPCFAMFKKKEPIEKMAKSLLKHRIQALTGRSSNDLEKELGFPSTREGGGIPIEILRRLAHHLILEASRDVNAPISSPAEVFAPATSSIMKTGAAANLVLPLLPSQKRKELSPQPEGEGMTPAKKARSSAKSSSRRSVHVALAAEASPRAVRTRKSMAPGLIAFREPAPTVASRQEDSCLPENPTWYMLDQMHKGIKAGKNASPPARKGFPGENKNQVFLVNGLPMHLTYEKLRRLIPSFSGANLVVVHTPSEWSPPQLLQFVALLRSVNADCKLNSFLVLVACGNLENVSPFRAALLNQTRHVQFVVFEREDKDDNPRPMKLRDTLAYFLLCYFFPGSDSESIEPPQAMVNRHYTTAFRAKNIEDLEHNILNALSEEGDWILDLFCGRRELTVAAQKMGRNAIAIDPSEEDLLQLREITKIISMQHCKSFKPEVDGALLQF